MSLLTSSKFTPTFILPLNTLLIGPVSLDDILINGEQDLICITICQGRYFHKQVVLLRMHGAPRINNIALAGQIKFVAKGKW